MYTEDQSRQDVYSVKKNTARFSYPYAYPSFNPTTLVDVFFNTLTQASRYVLGVADASLEAVRTFNAQLIYNSLRNQGYSNEYIRDMFEVNAHYHEQMSSLAQRHQVENYDRQAEYHQYMANRYRKAAVESIKEANSMEQQPTEVRSTQSSGSTQNIDYDLLARKVAEELRKNQQP